MAPVRAHGRARSPNPRDTPNPYCAISYASRSGKPPLLMGPHLSTTNRINTFP